MFEMVELKMVHPQRNQSKASQGELLCSLLPTLCKHEVWSLQYKFTATSQEVCSTKANIQNSFTFMTWALFVQTIPSQADLGKPQIRYPSTIIFSKEEPRFLLFHLEPLQHSTKSKTQSPSCNLISEDKEFRLFSVILAPGFWSEIKSAFWKRSGIQEPECVADTGIRISVWLICTWQWMLYEWQEHKHTGHRLHLQTPSWIITSSKAPTHQPELKNGYNKEKLQLHCALSSIYTHKNVFQVIRELPILWNAPTSRKLTTCGRWVL